MDEKNVPFSSVGAHYEVNVMSCMGVFLLFLELFFVLNWSARPRVRNVCSHDAMLVRYLLSSCVCPSVCPSVTRHCCVKTAKRTITQTTPRDSPGTLVF